jgi:hypothetical protein
VLQRANGDFDLLIWQEVSSYDIQKRQDVAVTPVPVTLRFAIPVEKATVYHPNLDTQEHGTFTNTTAIPLSVPDEVLIVRLHPKLVASTPAPAATAPVAQAAPTSVTLTWTGKAGTEYLLSRDGVFMTTTTALTFTDNTVKAGHSYRYELQTVSPGGDLSPRVGVNTATPARYPDLVITDLSWTPAAAKAGDTLTFTAVLKNQGDAPTLANTMQAVTFFVDGKYICFGGSTDVLAPGASRTVTATSNNFTLTAGQHTVRALADDVNRIDEGSAAHENNNTLEKPLMAN